MIGEKWDGPSQNAYPVVIGSLDLFTDNGEDTKSSLNAEIMYDPHTGKNIEATNDEKIIEMLDRFVPKFLKLIEEKTKPPEEEAKLSDF